MAAKSLKISLVALLTVVCTIAEAKKVVYCTDEAGAFADLVTNSLNLAGRDPSYFLSIAQRSCYEDEVSDDLEVSDIQPLKHNQAALKSYFWNAELDVPVKVQFYTAEAYMNGEMVMLNFFHKKFEIVDEEEFDSAKAQAAAMYQDCPGDSETEPDCFEKAFLSSME